MYDHEHQAQETRSTKRSPITIEVSPELRRRIKLAATQNDLSVSEYLSRILNEVVPDEASMTQQERRPVTPEFLEQVYRVRERIIHESGGHIFEDSAERIRQQREERTRQLMGEEE
jgi:hypothetical protein